MKTNRNHSVFSKISLIRLLMMSSLLSISSSCMNPVPQPPSPFFMVRTTYKSAQGQDLLDQTLPNSFKQADIKVVTKVESNGIVEVVKYNDINVVRMYFDDVLQSNCFYLSVPKNLGKNPIETIVTLSKIDNDTVTYTYGPTVHEAYPDKIYYNKKLVWKEVNIPIEREGKYPPIIVVK